MKNPSANTPPPPADRLQFRAGVAAVEASAVDVDRGSISRVSLLTGDREASGHGLWIDGKTVAGFHRLLDGARLKAYVTHGHSDGTLNEVGYWEKTVVDGEHLRADFVALDAWKKHAPAEFDTLFELAQKLPSQFGASLSFRFTLAWVRRDGTETPTVRKWRYGSDGYEGFFEPPAPAGALRELPSVRPVEVYSADFVDQPAANSGLFKAGCEGTTPGESETEKLRRELNAIKGTDQASAHRRGEIVAALKRLRAAPELAASPPANKAKEIEALQAQLQAVTGTMPSAARRRGEIVAQIKALRAA